MYTIGGIFSKDNLQDKLVEEDSFFQIDENKVVNIDVPLLTYYEKMILDKNILNIKENLWNVSEKVGLFGLLKCCGFLWG